MLATHGCKWILACGSTKRLSTSASTQNASAPQNWDQSLAVHQACPTATSRYAACCVTAMSVNGTLTQSVPWVTAKIPRICAACSSVKAPKDQSTRCLTRPPSRTDFITLNGYRFFLESSSTFWSETPGLSPAGPERPAHFGTPSRSLGTPMRLA